MPTGAGRVRPIEKFATSLGKCSTELSAYGKCAVTDYSSISKDKCLNEFMRLKQCFVQASKSK